MLHTARLLILAQASLRLASHAALARPSIRGEAALFDYDRSSPLDVKETRVDDREGVKVHDVTFASPKGGRVPAFLVVPPGKGLFAGIVYMHWGQGDRSSFLPEAMLLARAGAVSILIDAPFRRPAPWRKAYDTDWSKPETDRDMYIQTVVDLRRAVDVLVSRPDFDPQGEVRQVYSSHGSARRYTLRRQRRARFHLSPVCPLRQVHIGESREEV